MFLAAIDSASVAVSLLTIAGDLGGIELMGWVMSGYLVSGTVAAPLYGKLSDLYGRRPLLTVAITISLTASALCALAQSMPQLIAFRLLQGVGGGGVLAVAQATVGDVAHGTERGRWQAYFSGVYAAAALAGPILGGYLTAYMSWRALFVANLPLALTALVVSRRVLATLAVPHRRHAIDWPGALLLIAGLGTLLTALTRIGQGHGWAEASTLQMIAASAVLLGACALQELRAEEPVLPPAMFANRTVLLNSFTLALAFFVLVGCSVMLPLAMQTLAHASADDVALRMLPLTLATPFGSLLAGRGMVRTGTFRPFMIAGSAMCVPCLVAIAWTPPQATLVWVAALTVLGLGLGFVMPAALVGLQMAVPAHQVGIVTATNQFFRNFGGAVGIAILTSVLFNAARELAPGGAGAQALLPSLALGALAGRGEALAPAFRTVFMIAAGCALAGLLLSWAVRPRASARHR